jgi:hypothetical protein
MLEPEVPLDGGSHSAVIRVGMTVVAEVTRGLRRFSICWSTFTVKDLLARRVRLALTTKGGRL